ncbi:AI-2E family transporter [Candidatus Gracilibacteria bacterium]|nr:AI-2E family transporter [Candidatus Gracilibacteria bacterium]
MSLSKAIGLIALIISCYILWQIRQLLLLFFTAIVLATAIDRLVQLLQQWVKQRVWAILLSFAILLFLLTLIFWLIVPAFADQLQQLIELLPQVFSQIQTGLNWVENRIDELDFINIPHIDALLQQLQPYISQLFAHTFNFFSAYIEAILQLVLVLVLSLMLLVNPQPYKLLFIRLFPSFYRRRASEIISHCEVALGNWTTGVLIQMSFVALLSGIGLWILQVPLALAHAILAGLLDLIPNIGPTLAAVFPIAIALLDAPWKAVAVLIFYVVIQQVESYWLTPTIMAKQVSLLPAITLIAQIVFASFFGALGLLIALPLTVVAKTWIEEVLFKDFLDKWQQAPS